MRTSVRGKRIIVTAGAGGIGRAIVEQLAREGAVLATCDISEAALSDLRTRLPQVIAETVDVSKESQLTQFLNSSIEKMGGVDGLVNNAGISGPTACIEDIKPSEWQTLFDINVQSHFVACRAVVPHLKAQGDGSVIFISSTAGRLGFQMPTPYAASKWALVGLMKSLAIEIGPKGVRYDSAAENCRDEPVSHLRGRAQHLRPVLEPLRKHR
ncbi:SDR family NAD(P)-dependent oxidoreductase, partial [Mesorhizobium sp. M0684]|uniref:SDR family NAD(P)-dependent oxidoreductase n=1 Tax=Mesorhizobium sp. M0684 TaxID=2956986 RepID=UPI0033364870